MTEPTFGGQLNAIIAIVCLAIVVLAYRSMNPRIPLPTLPDWTSAIKDEGSSILILVIPYLLVFGLYGWAIFG